MNCIRLFSYKGQRTDIYYGNTTKIRYVYDATTFRLTRLLTTRNAGQDILQDLNYTYDAVGNIVEQVDNAQQTHYYSNTVVEPKGKYEYDAMYRLLKATGRELHSLSMPTDSDFANNIGLPNTASNAMQNYTHNYSYDELGNMQTVQSVGNWTRDYFYNTNDNYLLGHTEGVTEYTYDAHGNMLTMPHLQALHWDYNDWLTKVELDATGNKAYYVYNAGGERVRKVVVKGLVREERYYFGDYEIYHKFVNDVLETERTTVNISDNKKKIATAETLTVDQGSLTINPVAVVRYQYDNHLGSASLELDETGAIISYEEYHPFGTTSYRSGRTETETSQKRYKYVGKERDEETGLYYYGARYYASWLCRFVSVDPMKEERSWLTPYNYVQNNPLNRIDPDGALDEEPPNESANMHKISSGDTFWGIENKMGLSHGTLQKLNPGIDSRKLQIGSEIIISPEVGPNDCRRIDGLSIGLVNFDWAAISVSGEYAIHPITGGANAGNWLVRRYYMNEMYEDVLIGGSDTFSELVRENFITADLTLSEVNQEKSRTAIEWYKDITNEEEAMADFFENPSWSNYGVFVRKRIWNQYTNPINYLRLMAGSPNVSKVNVKGSLQGFNKFNKNNPLPKEWKLKGQGTYNKIQAKRYKASRNKQANNLQMNINDTFNTTVTNIKTIVDILNSKRNE